MKKIISILLSFICCSVGLSYGQTLSSKIQPDNSVVFKVKAPYSTSITVRCGTESVKLSRDAEGIWSGTTKPMLPGFHYMSMSIDGIQIAAPTSPTYFGSNKECSGLEIPEPGTEDFEISEVPHGMVSTVKYYSSVTKGWRELCVYTPAGYNEGNKKYPVLYLQHGGGENQTSWFNQGRADNILDNLIASGKAVPMIVVCADGKIQSSLTSSSSGTAYQWESMQAIREEIVDNVIPFIEKNFRVKSSSKYRAICGLSMGGGQSYFLGLRLPEVFGSVGVFSASVFGGVGKSIPEIEKDIPGIYTNVEQFNKSHQLFYLSCGEQDMRLQHYQRAYKELVGNGVTVQFDTFPGDHEWQPWRKSLKAFVQLLFK